MNIYSKKIVTVLLFLFTLPCAYAQESLVSGGGEAHSAVGVVSYSVGLVFFRSIASHSGSVNPSVQQAFPAKLVDSYELSEEMALSVKVYPNPGKNPILSINAPQPHHLFYQLSTPSGQVVRRAKINASEGPLHLEGYEPGWYLLSVTNEKKILKTIKLVINR